MKRKYLYSLSFIHDFVLQMRLRICRNGVFAIVNTWYEGAAI